MTTLNHIVYDIKGALRGGTLPALMDDDPLMDDHIKFKIHNTRALLIRQDLNKGNSISDNITQTLSCIEMELVDSSECPELPSTCKIYRSVQKIPQFAETEFDDIVVGIRNVDVLSDTFDLFHLARAADIVKNPGRVPHRGGIAFFKERYLYIVNYKKLLRKVSIDAVFDNPEEVIYFQGYTEECSPVDNRYPISQWMIKPLSDIVIDYFKKGIQGSDVKEDNSFNIKSNNEAN